jgi:hypothetical protein
MLGAAVALAAAFAAAASERGLGHPAPMLPSYRQECAACHVAYPPGLLPAASWQRLMSNLPRHFGTDASLDPAMVRDLADWLEANSTDSGNALREGVPPPEDRITRSLWFVREHREVAAATWKRPAVKSAANCAACHPQDDQGDFNEHAIRLPH